MRVSLIKLMKLLNYIIIISLFISCQSKDSGQGQGFGYANQPSVSIDYAQIKEKGVITAIVDNSSTSYFLYKGQPMGYEYELLKRLADELGLKLQIKVVVDINKAFEMLQQGKGDIIAHNLTVTKERSRKVAFTQHHNLVRQMLVQRKPKGWRRLKQHVLERKLIRNPINLAGKEVYVRKGSSHYARLKNLSDEIGEDIIIVEDFGQLQTEDLMQRVADGEIDYTVADEDVALIHATYYPDLDVQTPISFSQKIAWAVRKNSPQLLGMIDNWIKRMKKKPTYYVIYNKYFKNKKASLQRKKSQFFSKNEGFLSPYDSLIKAGALSIGWDWRLLAAQIYQESKFDPEAKSWAGAVGLMQLVPHTAELYGARDPLDPSQSIQAGTQYLTWLDQFWADHVVDEAVRLKYILASYNVGQGHVMDAYRLTLKFKKDPLDWQQVAYYLAKKSEEKYKELEEVKWGYCRGEEPVNYVKEIFNRFEQYKNLVPVTE